MDYLVLNTQKWVNKNYKGKSGYSEISEDGVTGWGTMGALIKALQIELGATVDGDFGPGTASLFTTLSKSYSNNQNIIYILQGGLYCKGYDAGTFNGIFTDKTELAIKELQQDAGITSTGTVNSTLMKAILTMDSFKLLNYGEYNGDTNIRKIQQNLNEKYSNNSSFIKKIGLVPCNGIYERTTNKALLIALQIEENLSNIDGIWGPSTKNAAPTLSPGSTKKNFIYLLQYALYCNGFDPNGFDGGYGTGVKTAVSNFQKFCALDSDGITGKQTWASLLVSTGDSSRKGTMCDCATTITASKAQTLKNSGYKSVGRYLTGKFKMTSNELNVIFSAGLNVFPIFETGGYKLSYFNISQGNIDAKAAIAAAHNLGFDNNTIIYFTVDFDALDQDVTTSILPYFSEIYQVFKRTKTTYKIGIYAPRNVCSRVSDAGYSCSSFVCDMSSGFSGNLGYPLPKDWAIDQISTITIGSGNGQIEVDNNISSGKDFGVSTINIGNNANGIIDSYTPDTSTPQTPSLPLSNGFEYIVVSGKEKNIENGIQRYKYNFIETGLKKLYEYHKNKSTIPAGSVRLLDTYTWLVHRYEYSDTDLKHFQNTANTYGYKLVIFNSNQEFINYINTGSLSGNSTRTQLIKEFTLFSHGHPGDVCFADTSNGDDTPFYISDIYKLNKNVFYNNVSRFYACNVATGKNVSEDDTNNNAFDSFGYKWAKHLNCNLVQACFRKTTYQYISSKTLADKILYNEDRKPYGYIQTGSYHYPEPTDKKNDSCWIYF